MKLISFGILIFVIILLANCENSSVGNDVEDLRNEFKLLKLGMEKMRVEHQAEIELLTKKFEEEITKLKVDFDLKLEINTFTRERRQADTCVKCVSHKGVPGTNGTDGVDGLPGVSVMMDIQDHQELQELLEDEVVGVIRGNSDILEGMLLMELMEQLDH